MRLVKDKGMIDAMIVRKASYKNSGGHDDVI